MPLSPKPQTRCPGATVPSPYSQMHQCPSSLVPSCVPTALARLGALLLPPGPLPNHFTNFLNSDSSYVVTKGVFSHSELTLPFLWFPSTPAPQVVSEALRCPAPASHFGILSHDNIPCNLNFAPFSSHTTLPIGTLCTRCSRS